MTGHPNPREEGALEVLRECACGRVRLLARALSSIYDEALRGYGIKGGQLTTLALLTYQSGLPYAEVHRKLAMDRSTVSRNLSVMRKRGWIEIGLAGGGGKRVVEVTELGRTVLEEALPAWRAAQARAREQVGADGFEAIQKVANELLRHAADR